MDPEHGLLRWGNYNWTLLLSSKVFEADDRGRSYRLRPLTRSIWLRKVPIGKGFPAFFLVPDGPGLADAIRGTGAVPLESSRQTTSSLGLRGPEPDVDAPLRGLILGDSFMQGMFIGDDETPPECLRRYLQGRLKRRASILNTGVLGYSPEQYYHSLIAFADRFRPHFVVVSLCANDFGNIFDATSQGVGDWQEGRYWLQKIVLYCKARRTPCLIVPAPVETSMMTKRNSGYFPGILANILDVEPRMFLDPMDDFLNAHMQSRIECQRNGRVFRGCALFNDDIGDSHFSRDGSEVWADSVGRRLVLLLEDDRLLWKPDTSRRDDGRPRHSAENQTAAGAGSKRSVACFGAELTADYQDGHGANRL
jgi:lysophospholipase L1-like esterase